MEKEPVTHYIPEIAQAKELRQVDIIRATGADKGTVSRWFNERHIPQPRYRRALMEVLGLEDEKEIFQPPAGTDERSERLRQLALKVDELTTREIEAVLEVAQTLAKVRRHTQE